MLKHLLMAALLLCSAAASAQSVFDVRLDPAPYSRTEAREQALRLVLARITGDRAQDSWVQDEALGDPQRYLHSEPDGPGYNARFDGEALLPLLQSGGLDVWLEPRPPVLVWLLDEGRPRSEADRAWRQAASAYQLPLLWPLWDLQEHMQIDTARLFEPGMLRDASARYGADYWLAVEDDGERLRWQLFGKDDDQALTEGALAAGDEATTALLAALNRYWVEEAGGREPPLADNPDPLEPLSLGQDAPGELSILVSGLRRFTDSIRLEQQLRALDGVEQAYVAESAGHQFRFRLVVAGSRASVLQAVAALPGLSAAGEREFTFRGGE